MNRLVFAGVVLVGLGSILPASPASAEESYTARPEARVAAACMGCQAKCRKCAAQGSHVIFKSVEACIADCKAHGNPLVVPTCGVYQACR